MKRFFVIIIIIACSILAVVIFSELQANAIRRAFRSGCANNMAQIGRLYCLYSLDNSEQRPSLHDLASLTNCNLQWFVCPFSQNQTGTAESIETWSSYVLPKNNSTSANSIIVYCKENHAGLGSWYMYNDGSMCWTNRTEIQENAPTNHSSGTREPAAGSLDAQ